MAANADDQLLFAKYSCNLFNKMTLAFCLNNFSCTYMYGSCLEEGWGNDLLVADRSFHGKLEVVSFTRLYSGNTEVYA